MQAGGGRSRRRREVGVQGDRDECTGRAVWEDGRGRKFTLGLKCKCRPPGFRPKHNRWGLWLDPPLSSLSSSSCLSSDQRATLQNFLLDYLTIMPALSTNDPLWFVRCARTGAARSGGLPRAAFMRLGNTSAGNRGSCRLLRACACACV